MGFWDIGKEILGIAIVIFIGIPAVTLGCIIIMGLLGQILPTKIAMYIGAILWIMCIVGMFIEGFKKK